MITVSKTTYSSRKDGRKSLGKKQYTCNDTMTELADALRERGFVLEDGANDIVRTGSKNLADGKMIVITAIAHTSLPAELTAALCSMS